MRSYGIWRCSSQINIVGSENLMSTGATENGCGWGQTKPWSIPNNQKMKEEKKCTKRETVLCHGHKSPKEDTLRCFAMRSLKGGYLSVFGVRGENRSVRGSSNGVKDLKGPVHNG